MNYEIEIPFQQGGDAMKFAGRPQDVDLRKFSQRPDVAFATTVKAFAAREDISYLEAARRVIDAEPAVANLYFDFVDFQMRGF